MKTETDAGHFLFVGIARAITRTGAPAIEALEDARQVFGAYPKRITFDYTLRGGDKRQLLNA